MFFAVAGFTAYADETDVGENSTAAETDEGTQADADKNTSDKTSEVPKTTEKPAVPAADTAVVPDPTEDFYVLDNAGVLTEKPEPMC